MHLASSSMADLFTPKRTKATNSQLPADLVLGSHLENAYFGAAIRTRRTSCAASSRGWPSVSLIVLPVHKSLAD